MLTDLDLSPAGGFGPIHTRRMRDWFGLTPAKGSACLLRAAGKHHRRYPCPGCDDLGRLTLLDHGSTWRSPDGRRIVIGEPYELSHGDLAALRERAAEYGLVIERLPISPWYPGQTHAWATYLPGAALAPAPQNGAVLRVVAREILTEPDLPEQVTWPEQRATVYIPEHMRPPLCPECDGPALPSGSNFIHDVTCDLAAVDWTQYEADLITD